MSGEELKACVDCKFFEARVGTSPTCGHPETFGFDMVFGKKPRFCQDARQPSGRCGWDANFFEPKEDADQ